MVQGLSVEVNQGLLQNDMKYRHEIQTAVVLLGEYEAGKNKLRTDLNLSKLQRAASNLKSVLSFPTKDPRLVEFWGDKAGVYLPHARASSEAARFETAATKAGMGYLSYSLPDAEDSEVPKLFSEPYLRGTQRIHLPEPERRFRDALWAFKMVYYAIQDTQDLLGIIHTKTRPDFRQVVERALDLGELYSPLQVFEVVMTSVGPAKKGIWPGRKVSRWTEKDEGEHLRRLDSLKKGLRGKASDVLPYMKGVLRPYM